MTLRAEGSLGEISRGGIDDESKSVGKAYLRKVQDYQEKR